MTDLIAAARANPDARWISVAQAARESGMSEAQIRRRLQLGELTGARVLGRIAVLAASVTAYRGA